VSTVESYLVEALLTVGLIVEVMDIVLVNFSFTVNTSIGVLSGLIHHLIAVVIAHESTIEKRRYFVLISSRPIKCPEQRLVSGLGVTETDAASVSDYVSVFRCSQSRRHSHLRHYL